MDMTKDDKNKRETTNKTPDKQTEQNKTIKYTEQTTTKKEKKEPTYK